MKWKLLSRVWLFATSQTEYSLTDFSVHRILQARILEWVAVLFSRDLPNPGIEPSLLHLQADSLPAELSGKSREINGKRTWKRIGPRQIALLRTWNQRNTVNQLYSNIEKNMYTLFSERKQNKTRTVSLKSFSTPLPHWQEYSASPVVNWKSL